MIVNLKILLCFLFCNLVLNVQASTDTSASYFHSHHYFTICSDSSKDLMIYLHGGVNNPYFKQDQSNIPLNKLVEENTHFIEVMSQSNFDLLLPITNDSMNWVEDPETSFNILLLIIQSMEKKYDRVFISGFSDGGTASYKIFYAHPDSFSGLVVFNGYPQHKNHQLKVSYSKITDKPVVFYGTFHDKNIPYEFMMTEYCKQKKFNANTFLYLTKGGHDFSSYSKTDIIQLSSILLGQIKNNDTEVIHGYMQNDSLIYFYRYRKNILRKYSFGNQFYQQNKKQMKELRKSEQVSL